MREDYLLIDGKKYSEDDLDKLPGNLSDAKNHCLITNNQVSFLGYRCPLSNFFQCKFKHGTETFTSSEQLIQYTKAKRFTGNDLLCEEIMRTHEPHKIKNLGYKVRNYNNEVWKSEAVPLLYEGLKSKFTQCSEPFHFLKSTGKKLIVEASESDKLFGIGQSIKSTTLLSSDIFVGSNIQGNMLMTIRDTELSNMVGPLPSLSPTKRH